LGLTGYPRDDNIQYLLGLTGYPRDDNIQYLLGFVRDLPLMAPYTIINV
jgi:hypothetical protein